MNELISSKNTKKAWKTTEGEVGRCLLKSTIKRHFLIVNTNTNVQQTSGYVQKQEGQIRLYQKTFKGAYTFLKKMSSNL